MPTQKQLDEARAEIEKWLGQPGARACRRGLEPIGPGRDVLGWQAEAGEEDQSAPGWDSGL